MLVVVPVLVHLVSEPGVYSVLFLLWFCLCLVMFLAAFREKREGEKHCMACDKLVGVNTWHCPKCHTCRGLNKSHTRFGCLDRKFYYRHNILCVVLLVGMLLHPMRRLVPLYLSLALDYLFQAEVIKWPRCTWWSPPSGTSTGGTSPSLL